VYRFLMISLKTLANFLDNFIIVVMVALPYFLSLRTSMIITISVAVALFGFQYYLLRKGIIKSFPKLIDVTVFLLSIALLVVDYYIPDKDREEFEKMIPVFIYGSFFLMAFVSILFNRPFTMQFAKNSTPSSVWTQPGFLKVNEKITYVWMLAFLTMTASSSIPVMFNVSNTGKIISTAVIPVVLIILTKRYRGGY